MVVEEPSLVSRQNLVVAATFTVDPLVRPLEFLLKAAELEQEISLAPYNQVFQELLDPNSMLGTNRSGANVVIIRMEDFVRDLSEPRHARGVLERTSQEIIQSIKSYLKRTIVPTIIAVLPATGRSSAGLMSLVDAANSIVTAGVEQLPGLVLLVDSDIEVITSNNGYDELSDNLAHVPYTDEHYAALAIAITRKLRALKIPPHKVLVLDCDQTLWRGVVGEEGVSGISIPAELAAIQRFAVAAQSRGTLICLVSKNVEEDVLEVFETRDDMILRKEHIVAHRINWESKPNNVRSLARILNLGLDSFVMLDDNPVECELMRAELPEVLTLQVPSEGSEVYSLLSTLWVFDKVAVTDEDSRRTAMYRENAAREELEGTTANFGEFIESLKVETDIAPPDDNEWARLSQLTQRTNQFNFTTMRRTEAELRNLSSSGSVIFRVKVRDRFGDYGIVGLIVAKPASGALKVETFLLSCRVLGRGVEHAVIRHLGSLALQSGLAAVELLYVPTRRNEPARAFADSLESVRTFDENGACYTIASEVARGVAHRPGEDPVEIIDAMRSDKSIQKKGKEQPAPSAPSDKSRQYEAMASLCSSPKELLRTSRMAAMRSRPSGPLVEPSSTTQGCVLEIWKDVLGIEQLGIEDDYFALGGTSLEAARLIAELNRQFGANLTMTTILTARTVRDLTSILEGRDAGERGTLVEELRSGDRPGLHLVHDGDGEVLLYRGLAQRLPKGLRVTGIRPRPRLGIDLPYTSIEEMAHAYVAALKSEQAQGPYRVGGMCAGGVIAYEMARQLTEMGDRVECVLLLDAASPTAAKKIGRATKARFDRLSRMFNGSSEADQNLAGAYLALGTQLARKLYGFLRWEFQHRARQLSVSTRFAIARRLLGAGKHWPDLLPGLSVREMYDCAEPRYEPKVLKGVPVVLVRATAGHLGDTPYREIYSDDDLGWGRCVDALDIIDVQGGHSSMLQPRYVDGLAATISRFLSSQPPASNSAPKAHPASKPRAIA